MKKMNSLKKMSIISELTHGRELANQLKNQLKPTSSAQPCEILLEKILSSYDNALSVLNCMGLLGSSPPSPINGVSESSPHHCQHVVASPASDEGTDQYRREVYKKRKTLPRWSEQVKVCSGTGTDGPPDDGYSWRKYGQKDILGANFPRAYYRCTHRNTQGCLATKQVQRTDEDSSVFEVTYRGMHTCMLEKAKRNKENNPNPHLQKEEELGGEEKHANVVEMLSSSSIETTDVKEEIFPSFSFLTVPMDSKNRENEIFAEPIKENYFMGTCFPQYVSPNASESNYFCQVNFGADYYNMQSSESDITDMISSTPTSVTDSPFGDLDFTVDFDPNFTLDTSEYF